MRPHSFDVLSACLERLVEANLDWCEAARAHHDLLVSSRLEATPLTMEAMEKALLRIGDEEALRAEQSSLLAEDLGIPSDPPPRLESICAALAPDDAAILSGTGSRLKAAVLDAQKIADRIRTLAELGLRNSEATASAVRALATRSARPPAAYVRGGRRTGGTAIPVFDRTWKA